MIDLPPMHRSLLLLVNGFTPLRALADLTANEAALLEGAQTLLRARLVENVARVGVV
ncbi:hypothetical protein AACH06_28995 [Ideonella sp. DXS29W]|uniref:Uncharacterized protein n=1 Tax=Ideonella lacteola TaxID=2984193 RepID=A0ABU9BY14_9BURK